MSLKLGTPEHQKIQQNEKVSHGLGEPICNT